MWQDAVIAVGQLCFVPAMIPTLAGREKPAVASSVMNTAIVVVIASSQATLGLWLAAATGWVIAGVWAVLAVQGVRAGGRAGEAASGSCELVVDVDGAGGTPLVLRLDLPRGAGVRLCAPLEASGATAVGNQPS